jgi:hypothetical protein
LKRGIDSGKKPLRGGLFIARRTVDLARKEKTPNLACFKAALQ